MACMYCKRDDKFVKESGACILHCSKDGWITLKDEKKVWDRVNVKLFWKTIRTEVMNGRGAISFQRMVFPIFEEPCIQVCSSSHHSHVMYEASSDFSFWAKGQQLCFTDKVDFSYVRFIEPFAFSNILFKEVDFNSVKSTHILFKESTISHINFKEIKVDKIVFKKSAVKKLFLDRVKVSKLLIHDNHIEKIFITKSKIGTVHAQNIQDGINIIVNDSQLTRFEALQLRNDRLNLSNSRINTVNINTINTEKFELQNSVIDEFLYQESNAHIFNINNSQFSKAFHIASGRISQFILEKSNILENASVWLSDLIFQTFKIDSMMSILPTCSFEHIKIQQLFSLQNLKINMMYAHEIDCSATTCHIAFKNMIINEANSMGFNWGVLKHEGFDSDEKTLANLYRIYLEKDDIAQANLFSPTLSSKSLEWAEKNIEQRQVIREKGYSLSLFKKEVKAPIVKEEVDKRTSTITTFEDENAPILKSHPGFQDNLKNMFQKPCKIIGCFKPSDKENENE